MRESTRQTRIGTVVSNKMDKTVVVQTETQKQHPLYKKYIRRRKTFKAHDEANECNAGDRVKIMETRPISKDKRWRVVEIIERGFVATGEVIDPTEFFRKKKQKRDEKRAAMAAEAEKQQLEAQEEDIEDEEDLEAEDAAQAPAEPASEEQDAPATSDDEQAGDDDDSERDQA
jgi:small subunit ribosomal protein S17